MHLRLVHSSRLSSLQTFPTDVNNRISDMSGRVDGIYTLYYSNSQTRSLVREYLLACRMKAAERKPILALAVLLGPPATDESG